MVPSRFGGNKKYSVSPANSTRFPDAAVSERLLRVSVVRDPNRLLTFNLFSFPTGLKSLLGN